MNIESCDQLYISMTKSMSSSSSSSSSYNKLRKRNEAQCCGWGDENNTNYGYETPAIEERLVISYDELLNGVYRPIARKKIRSFTDEYMNDAPLLPLLVNGSSSSSHCDGQTSHLPIEIRNLIRIPPRQQSLSPRSCYNNVNHQHQDSTIPLLKSRQNVLITLPDLEKQQKLLSPSVSFKQTTDLSITFNIPENPVKKSFSSTAA